MVGIYNFLFCCLQKGHVTGLRASNRAAILYILWGVCWVLLTPVGGATFLQDERNSSISNVENVTEATSYGGLSQSRASIPDALYVLNSKGFLETGFYDGDLSWPGYSFDDVQTRPNLYSVARYWYDAALAKEGDSCDSWSLASLPYFNACAAPMGDLRVGKPGISSIPPIYVSSHAQVVEPFVGIIESPLNAEMANMETDSVPRTSSLSGRWINESPLFPSEHSCTATVSSSSPSSSFLLHCLRADCNRTFRSKAVLKRHIARHDRGFTCDTCGRKFGAKTDCDRHESTVHQHHREESLICPKADCKRGGKPFSRRDNLLKHIREVQEGKKSTYQRTVALRRSEATTSVAEDNGERERLLASMLEPFQEDNSQYIEEISQSQVGPSSNYISLDRELRLQWLRLRQLEYVMNGSGKTTWTGTEL